VVKIFAFLDLEQISADFEIERFETGSLVLMCFFNAKDIKAMFQHRKFVTFEVQ